jgi:hypothetical protein
MTSGGYQQPSNPAPVSGPGELSQRTDGGAIDGMTQPAQEWKGLPYSENKAVNDQQSGASMAGNPYPTVNITPLKAPTARLDEPVTAGNPFGDGPGTEALRGMPNYAPSLIDTIKHIAQFDPSGDAELLYRQLTDNGFA